MFRPVRSVLSFLTIIPGGSTSLELAARHMYAFPLAAIIIGLGAGAIGLGLGEAGVDPLIVGLVVAATIAIITGLHHTDGLADFADGLMVRGTRQKKLAAMKDAATGTAGTAAVVVYFVGMIIALSLSSGYELFLGILTAEMTAKFSMVLMAAAGRSATPGTNSPFISYMSRRKLAIAACITIIPLAALGGQTAMLALAAGVVVTLVMGAVSARTFGGITGDVFGALNELTRLASILVFVSV